MRSDRQATVPSLLSEERAYNPFMRVHMPSIRAAGDWGSMCSHACHTCAKKNSPLFSLAVAEASKPSGSGAPADLAEIPAMAGLRSLKNAKAHLAAQPLPIPGAGAGPRAPYADF